jgi:hypothetical protein|tara:strand:+ start:642 stop:893 length:252 start_codon:yes stop_codon:yes gene_type:complete
MKITKRQLRRIIKEEKQKLVEQSLTNWPEPEEDNLYTNLTDDQENALGALENAIKDCINEGCKADDIRDTVEAELAIVDRMRQ